MPITLNGTYWTAEEAAMRVGRTHSILCRWIRRTGMELTKVGATYLFSEDDMAALDSPTSSSKKFYTEEINNLILIRHVSLVLKELI